MIVYGDPYYEETLANLVAYLRAAIAAAANQDTANPPLDRLRALLVLAGQLEQAAQDGLPDKLPPQEAQQQITRLHSVTAHIADAFHAAWASGYVDRSGAARSLSIAGHILGSVDTTSEATLTVKIPEGFAFYALYPEQYCASATRWVEDHAHEPEKCAVVVGIRSIGTALGAVVAATLRAHGWQVESFNVRPSGHPFERYVEIAERQVGEARWGLVVDEGPGMSGSSMAAVGDALVQCGLPRPGVSFFPGHGGEPGSAASEPVRGWWAATPRYVTPTEQVRFEGRTLPKSLAAWLANLVGGCAEDAVQIVDVSGGKWREFVYDTPADWPPVCAPFERPKLLCTLPDGRRVLLKFEGFCGAPEAIDKSARAWGQHSLGARHGYRATFWLDGAPLTLDCVDDDMLGQIGRYITYVAGPTLTQPEQEAGLQRLADMLYWNTWEALGEGVAEQTRGWRDKVAALSPSASQCYGDGRMAPHEWIRTLEGEIAKVSKAGAGRARDHTCVGVQPVAWDLAGAIVEWELDGDAITTLLAAFYAAGGALIEQDALTFYRLAYAAFRMGQCHICANIAASDLDEQARLWRAYGSYRDEVSRLLRIE